jgi:hypothetical protein
VQLYSFLSSLMCLVWCLVFCVQSSDSTCRRAECMYCTYSTYKENEGKTLHSTYVPVKKHVLLSVKIWVHCKLLFRVFSLDPPRTELSQKLGPGGGVQFDACLQHASSLPVSKIITNGLIFSYSKRGCERCEYVKSL